MMLQCSCFCNRPHSMSLPETYASHLPASCLLCVKEALALQVATTATFAACALEALRMLLADLEQPGGTLITPIKAPMALLLPIAITLFPVALPAGFIGKMAAAAVMFAAVYVGYRLHFLSLFVLWQCMPCTLQQAQTFLNMREACCG